MTDLSARVEGLEAEVELLRSVVRDTLWMACRYAHGRSSYAVGMYNEAARKAMSLDFLHASPEPRFAIDGSLSAEMSGLTPDEFETAWEGWTAPNVIRTHCTAALKARDL